MIRKKQVVIMMSIAVVSFLIGTSMATDGGNPFVELWDAFHGLESRIEALENQSPPLGFVGAPAYDSGWIPVAPGGGVTCEHNLSTNEIFVYLVGRWVNSDVHQMLYGEITYYYDDDWQRHGVSWYAQNIDQIYVHRGAQDVRWEEIRVYIWVIGVEEG